MNNVPPRTSLEAAREYGNMTPQEFAATLSDKWKSAQTIMQGVIDEVSAERLTPLEGAKATSCIVGELFHYGEFHGGISSLNPVDIVASLREILGRD